MSRSPDPGLIFMARVYNTRGTVTVDTDDPVTLDKCTYPLSCRLTNLTTTDEVYRYISDCPDGRFGPNCVYECHCQNLKPCDKRTGKCKQCYDRWIGQSCQKKCAARLYGTDSKETCGKCKENLCDHETGQCLNGCNAGWKGNRCNSGKCLDECNAGWIGDLCNTRCPDGRFGVNCVYECHCQNHGSCDKHTGKCTHCYDGWIGIVNKVSHKTSILALKLNILLKIKA
ncbi:unnamed protein product [Mytilus coruscus]|uniref:MEGF10_11 n=1 Tax=Mytilus coruscus TaxID=42192 RepID=A0A6J8BHW2_MYTCO|nr:unnamed protein product [Mytilus coruscus]